MRNACRPAIIMLLAASFIAHPALARAGAGTPDAPRTAAEPVGAGVPADRFDAHRRWVSGALAALGHDAAEANRLAGRLTPEDLAVLRDNPRMLQPAGALSASTETIIIGLLIIAGLIALAAAGDGFVMFNS